MLSMAGKKKAFLGRPSGSSRPRVALRCSIAVQLRSAPFKSFLKGGVEGNFFAKKFPSTYLPLPFFFLLASFSQSSQALGDFH
jgi:hypothetical protein